MLASIRLPVSFRSPLYGLFSNFYEVRLEEAEFPRNAYPSFGSFFTRRLKEGLRPIGSGLISPVDGRIAQCGDIENGSLLQAKGIHYTVKELLGGMGQDTRFQNGSFATFYLAPGDYHHIHSPVGGRIVKRIYIPGALLPVSMGAVRSIPSLYCTNERLISIIETDDDIYAVVKVGATNVGSIGIAYEASFLRELKGLRVGVDIKTFDPGLEIKKGDLLGTFHLGSTVVLLTGKIKGFDTQITLGTRVRMGQSLEK